MPKEVPLFRDLAVKLGFVNAQEKDAFLKLQAAERVLGAYEGDASSDIFNKAFNAINNNDITEVNRLMNDKMFTREYIRNPNIPKDLQAIQAVNHLTDIFVSYDATDKAIIDKTAPAILMLGNFAYSKAATNINELAKVPETNLSHPLEAANTIIKSINNEFKDKFPNAEKTLDFNTSINVLKQGIELVVNDIKTKSPQLGEKLESIVKERLEQARSLEPEKAINLDRRMAG